MNFHWTQIISLDNSQNNAFEELVCQLAKKETIKNKKEFIKVGNPDGGVECYIVLDNDDEIGFQAKWFLSTPDDTQWNQVEKSLKRALDTHPKLTQYYIAIPIDRPDPRISGQRSMMEKWNEKVTKWKKFAKDNYDREIEFEYWGRSEFLERLSREENVGLKNFFFGDIDLSDKWFQEQNELAIKDLGARYTPEINVELEILENFDAISRNNQFQKQFDDSYHNLILSTHKLNLKYSEILDLTKELHTKIDILKSLYNDIHFLGILHIDINPLRQSLEEMQSLGYQISELLHDANQKEIKEQKLKSSHGYRQATQYDGQIKKVYDYLSKLSDFKDLVDAELLQLANNPFMILDGEPGIGKSHLLADIVTQRIEQNSSSILLLGQHFREDKNPWSQIRDLLQLKCNKDELLGALNAKAEAQNKRLIIFIDAINEGRGRDFWNEFLIGFIESIKKYEWLGLVLSIRSSYCDLIIPQKIIDEESIIKITHQGFEGVEYNASKLFFKNYNILQPSIPLLHPEFSNPLFLKLFCDGLNKKGLVQIPDGYEGITNIVQFFIEGIESKLLNKYPNIKSLKLLKKVIEAIINELLDKETLEYDKALEVIISISSKYGISSELLDDLIAEGLLIKNLFYDYETKEHTDAIYFAYERFADHLKVKYLFEKYLDTNNPQKSFEQEPLKNYFEENNLYYYKGMIDAMSIQLPEICNVELIDMLGQNQVTLDGFFHSLLPIFFTT